MNSPEYPNAKHSNEFERGLGYQDFVCVELAKRHVILQNIASKRFQFDVGENLQGYEIKLDERCGDTGRLSIEVAEKSKADMPNWTPSGIFRDDNSWLYVQGNYQIIFIFTVKWLRKYHDFQKRNGKLNGPDGGYYTSFGTVRKFYVSIDLAREHAALVINVSEGLAA